MHIEPGIVDGAKIVVSYATATGAFGLIGKMAVESAREDGQFARLIARTVATTVLVLIFFEVFPHVRVGVSEVHLILGSTLFLVFGAGPAAIGLALGLLLQGLLFEPQDLPQYGMNVTTLVVPLYAMSLVAKRIIAKRTAYADLSYRQVLALSTTFQGGIVGWVAFWALYGRGFAVENLGDISTFAVAYMSVLLLEPIIDLTTLAAAKAVSNTRGARLMLQGRVHLPSVPV